MIDRICRQINNIKNFEDVYEEVEFFKIIYESFTLEEWLTTDNVFVIGNYIAQHRPDLVTLGIRLNVQINLFLRTINNYSTNADYIFKKVKHSLGCFALTENEAGVLSGLIVKCQFKKKGETYIINSKEIFKNWISQGIISDYMLVFASNVDDSKDVRIFLCAMSNKNIIKESLDLQPFTKTLDLAKLRFNNLIVPETNVLDLTISKSKMEILNGILYGRYMIAEAVVHSILGLVLYLKDITLNVEKFKHLGYDKYILNLEKILNKYINHLSSIRNKLLTSKNIFLINCYKIFVVETSIKIFNELNMKFGVIALKYGLKYETLLLNKVAEGDTNVLRLSLIHTHFKKGYWNMIFKEGLTFYEIVYLSILNEKEKKMYIMDNFKNISDKIIQNNICIDLY